MDTKKALDVLHSHFHELKGSGMPKYDLKDVTEAIEIAMLELINIVEKKGHITLPTELTKREYIAITAMQGILATKTRADIKYSIEEVIPKAAVIYADKLMEFLANKGA